MINKNSEAPEDQRVEWVSTFHEYAISIGTTAGSPQFYGEEIDRYREDLISKASTLSVGLKFDAWVVDEAQDFLPSWWETLKLSLRDPESGKMALFGDDQQLVFGPRSEPEGFFASLRLKENLRNSQQIALAISKFIEKPTIARGPYAFEIEYVEVTQGDTFEVADDVVANLTDKEFWHPGEIALLTTKKRHPEHERQSDHDKVGHWDSLWTNEDVFYCTVSGFKGLERPVVVLAIDGFHEDSDQDDVLYVGMSRARDKLVVVASREMIQYLRELRSE
jgi:superfamily I DNA/RNA helicase